MLGWRFQNVYKIEFFDSKMNYQCSHFFDVDEISYDYLTQEATEIILVGKCTAQKGSFAHITGDDCFDCIVSDIRPDMGVTKVSIRPLQALFDFEVFTEPITDVAEFIFKQIKNTMVENVDILQNRPLEIHNIAFSSQRPMVIEQNKVNLIDVLASALTTYQIAVDCKLNMKQKTVVAIIEYVAETKVIEADLKNVISKEITLGDSYGSFNKVFIRETSTNNETGAITILNIVSFFLHTDGTISTIDMLRISPVFFTIEDLETSVEWNIKALEKASELLVPQQFDNEINLTYKKQDKITNPQQMKIGTGAIIYTNDKAYTSILTGKVIAKNTILLIFGAVRVDLTKKLILERRKRK